MPPASAAKQGDSILPSDKRHIGLGTSRARCEVAVASAAASLVTRGDVKDGTVYDLWGCARTAKIVQSYGLAYVAYVEVVVPADRKRLADLRAGGFMVVEASPVTCTAKDAIVFAVHCGYWLEHRSPSDFARLVADNAFFVVEHDFGMSPHAVLTVNGNEEAVAVYDVHRGFFGSQELWLRMFVAGEPEAYYHPVSKYTTGLGDYCVSRLRVEEDSAMLAGRVVRRAGPAPLPLNLESQNKLFDVLYFSVDDALVSRRYGMFDSATYSMPARLSDLTLVEGLLATRTLSVDRRSPGNFRALDTALSERLESWRPLYRQMYARVLLDHLGLVSMEMARVGFSRLYHEHLTGFANLALRPLSGTIALVHDGIAAFLRLKILDARGYPGRDHIPAVQPWVSDPGALDLLRNQIRSCSGPKPQLRLKVKAAEADALLTTIDSLIGVRPAGASVLLGPGVLVQGQPVEGLVFSTDPLTKGFALAGRYLKTFPKRMRPEYYDLVMRGIAGEAGKLTGLNMYTKDGVKPVELDVEVRSYKPKYPAYLLDRDELTTLDRFEGRRRRDYERLIERTAKLGGVTEVARRTLENALRKGKHFVKTFVKTEVAMSKFDAAQSGVSHTEKPRPILLEPPEVLFAAAMELGDLNEMVDKHYFETVRTYRVKAPGSDVTLRTVLISFLGHKASELTPYINDPRYAYGVTTDQSSCDSCNEYWAWFMAKFLDQADPASLAARAESISRLMLAVSQLPVEVTAENRLTGQTMTFPAETGLVSGTNWTSVGNTVPLLEIGALVLLMATCHWASKEARGRVLVHALTAGAGDDDFKLFSHNIFDGFSITQAYADFGFNTKVSFFDFAKNPSAAEFVGGRVFGGALCPDPYRALAKLGWFPQSGAEVEHLYLRKVQGLMGWDAVPVLRAIRAVALSQLEGLDLLPHQDPDARYKVEYGVMPCTDERIRDFCDFYGVSRTDLHHCEAVITSQLRAGHPLAHPVIDRIFEVGRTL